MSATLAETLTTLLTVRCYVPCFAWYKAAVQATLSIFTFKEGLLSRVAHDLRIRGEATVVVDGKSVEIRARLADLRSEGAMVRGRLDRGALSSGDLKKIDATMRGEILDTRRHPEAVFRGTLERNDDQSFRLRGRLTLKGRERELELTARRRGEVLSGRLSLVPSRWGIKPYRALAGTLRLQDRVDVDYELPADAVEAS